MLGELTPEEIDEMLRSEAIGRIGCYAFGRPYVVPITFAYDGVAVYGHSREGLKLRMMRSHPSVCFEVDRMEGLSDWRSVIAMGTFSELQATQAETAMELLRRRIGPLVPSATSTRMDSRTPRGCPGPSSASCSESGPGASSARTPEPPPAWRAAISHPLRQPWKPRSPPAGSSARP